MKIKSYFNEKGLTLLEVLAVSALLLVITTISLSAFTNVLEDFKVGTEKSKLYKEAQKIEALLVDTVRATGYVPSESYYLEIDELNPNRYTLYAADNSNIYIFELDDNRLLYTKDGNTYVLSEHMTVFTLSEEGDATKKLIYTINLTSEVSGNELEIILEDRFIYFPVWTF